MLRFRARVGLADSGGKFRAVTSRGGALGEAVFESEEAPATFSVVHAATGANDLYQLAPSGLLPTVPVPGLPFLRDLLAPTSMDISFLRVLPGAETPYAMRHRRNEVVCIVTGGRGQFLIDGNAVDVASGTVLRIEPAAVRAWRNTSSEDLLLIMIQGRAGSLRRALRSDAVGVPGQVAWWHHRWGRGKDHPDVRADSGAGAAGRPGRSGR